MHCAELYFFCYALLLWLLNEPFPYQSFCILEVYHQHMFYSIYMLFDNNNDDK